MRPEQRTLLSYAQWLSFSLPRCDLALEPSKGGGIGQTLCPDLALGDGKIFRKEKENDRKAESARELGPVHFGEVTSFACENDG